MKAGVAPATAVADGVTKINRIVGVNINKVASIDATKPAILKTASADAQQYALYNAAFADLVNASNVQTVQTVLDTYYQEFSDGDFDAGNNLKNLLTNVQKQADAAIYKDSLSSAAKTDITQSVSLVSAELKTDGSYTPAPSDNTNLTEVEKAKSLVQETRNWVTSISALDSPAQAFNVEAQAVKENLGTESQAVIEQGLSVVSEAFSQIGDLKKNGKAIPSTLTIDNAVFNISVQESPTTKLTISNTNYLGINLNYSITLDKPLAEIVNANGTNISGKTYNGTLVSSSIKNNITTKLDTNLYLSVSSNITNNKSPVTAINVNGSLSSTNTNGSKISGAVTLETTALDADKVSAWRTSNDASMSQLNFSRFKLDNVTIATASGSSAGLGIDLKIDNAAKFDNISYLDGNMTNLHVHKCFATDVVNFTDLAKKNGITNLRYAKYNSSTAATSTPTTYLYGMDSNGLSKNIYLSGVIANANTYIEQTYLPDPNKWVSAVLAKALRYQTQADAGCLVEAEAYINVDVAENATNFIDGSVTLTGKMALKGYPEATASILFDRNAYNSAAVSIALAYNNKTLNISVSGDKTQNGQITVKSPADDTKLVATIVNGALSGNVTVDGKVVGKITDVNSGPMIRYNDGSMESL